MSAWLRIAVDTRAGESAERLRTAKSDHREGVEGRGSWVLARGRIARNVKHVNLSRKMSDKGE